MNSNTTLSFNGFNSGLGTLTQVVISFSGNMALNSTASVVPAGSGNGSVSAVSAVGTLTLTATGIGFFSNISNNLSTTPFTGTVLDNGAVQVLGTQNAPITGTSGNITNPFLTSQYVGGSNLFGLTMTSVGTQGGSVPANVLTGNTGNSSGSVSVVYTYTPSETPPPTGTPEPASMALLGAGLLGIGAIRRRRK